MMRSKLGFIIVAALLLVAACGTAMNSAAPNSLVQDIVPAPQATMVAAAPGDADGTVSREVEADEFQQQEQDMRVILKSASLTITVSNPAAKISEITTMAESMGGWVVTSNVYSSTNSADEDITYGSVTVRVPASRLTEALDRIKSGTDGVDGETINGQDVTSEYVDLSSRLKNLQATETQLQSIMETARKVDDVLSVQRELTTVRSEIETIQGRLNYFQEAASYSSIAVEVRPPQPGPVEAQSAGWNPGKTVEGALGTLIQLAQFAIDTLITVVILGGPIALIVGLPLWWGLRRKRNRRVAIAP